MDRHLMRRLINDGLDRIPRGLDGNPQNHFRASYQIRRQHALSIDPNRSHLDSFAQAIEDVRRGAPDFEPNVTDPMYFGWRQ